jgi:hypothetical protein
MFRIIAMMVAASALAAGALAQEAPAAAKQTMLETLTEILKDVRSDNSLRVDRRPGPPGASPADAIRSQLLARGCWGDQDNLADARRLRAILAVSFGPDGHFREPPKLIEPKAMPVNDPALETFILRARAALETCDAKVFQLSPEFLAVQPPVIIELEFRP